jgi:UDP-glucose 4-epimerase
MNILIVGGAGYIGSHTNKLLHQNGFHTIVLDNLSRGHRELVRWGTFISGDLENKTLLQGIFQKHPIDTVMHFSAFAYIGESYNNPAIYYQNNVSNTINLLNVMLEYDIKKFIFSSSCAIFGEPQYLPIDENHPKNPINPYGWSKLMVEKILDDYDRAYGMKYVSLRYFNAAGADPDGEIGEIHQPETHLIPLVIEAALGKKERVEVFGNDYDTKDGTCVRDYIHVSDLADAHYHALDWLIKGNKSEAFNLGNGRGFSVREIIDAVREHSKTDFKVENISRRLGDTAILIGSFEKAKELLGWNPKFTAISDIIKTSWEWHKKMSHRDVK